MPALLIENNSQYDMAIGQFHALPLRNRFVDFVRLPAEPVVFLYRPRGQQITLMRGTVALLHVFQMNLWLMYLFVGVERIDWHMNLEVDDLNAFA